MPWTAVIRIYLNTASARFDAFNLRRMCLTCVFTVPSEITRCVAIAPLLIPSAISETTSISLRDNSVSTLELAASDGFRHVHLIVNGVFSSGLMTTELPAASAGPTFQIPSSKGKFQGTMAAHTPSGS